MASDTKVDRVQDTARWVAIARARESERPDALFKDPYAHQLGGQVGEELAAQLWKTTGSWPIVARTWLIDRIVRDAVQDGVDAVLNLAAGLDTRPQRMELPATLTWIEVDHADIFADKEAVLLGAQAHCRLERVPLDLSVEADRRTLLLDVGTRFKRVLVLTEGLLPYLPEALAMTLAQDIRSTSHLDRWVFDLPNQAALHYVAKQTHHALQGTAQMRFGPDQGPRVFESLGFQIQAATSIFKTAGKLKRLPFPMWLFAMLPEPSLGDPRRPWSGVCVLRPV